jgi:two-component system, NarL family, response regulator DegU
MSNIGVLIADDHPIVCKGIRNLLEPAMGISVVGEAHSGAEALHLIQSLEPDVVLLDVELSDMSGIDVIKKLNLSKIKSRILGLSSYDDREFISQLLSLGASGYLLKDEIPEQIIEAVRGVARGETGWVSRKVAAKLSQILQKDQDGAADLTNRELQVLRLVVEAKTNGEIGMLLGISEKTVEKHLDTIFRKLGVASRVEAAVLAVRADLL